MGRTYLVINFLKNFAAFVFIAQIVLFIADKANLVSPKYQSVLKKLIPPVLR